MTQIDGQDSHVPTLKSQNLMMKFMNMRWHCHIDLNSFFESCPSSIALRAAAYFGGVVQWCFSERHKVGCIHN